MTLFIFIALQDLEKINSSIGAYNVLKLHQFTVSLDLSIIIRPT